MRKRARESQKNKTEFRFLWCQFSIKKKLLCQEVEIEGTISGSQSSNESNWQADDREGEKGKTLISRRRRPEINQKKWIKFGEREMDLF